MDALGNPTGFHLTGGQESDMKGADVLLPPLAGKVAALLADKGYNARERIIEPLEKAGTKAVIPPAKNAVEPRSYDKHLYNRRHLIENFFARLKQYRAIATRYDKRAANFLGAIHLAAAIAWLN